MLEVHVARVVGVQVLPSTLNFLESSLEGSILVFIGVLRVQLGLFLLNFISLFSRACLACTERVLRVPLKVSKLAEKACFFSSLICLRFSNTGFNLTVRPLSTASTEAKKLFKSIQQ